MRCSPTPRPRRQPDPRKVAAAIAGALRCTWHQIARCCTRNKIARYRVLRGGEEQVAPILGLFSKCAGLRAKGLAALLGCCAALCAQAHTSTLSRNSANCPPIAPSHPHPKSKVQRTDLSSAPCHLLSCVHPYHVGVQSSELWLFSPSIHTHALYRRTQVVHSFRSPVPVVAGVVERA